MHPRPRQRNLKNRWIKNGGFSRGESSSNLIAPPLPPSSLLARPQLKRPGLGEITERGTAGTVETFLRELEGIPCMFCLEVLSRWATATDPGVRYCTVLESFGDWVQISPLKSLLAHFWGEVTLSDPFLATLIDLRMIRRTSPELMFFFSARHFFPPTNLLPQWLDNMGF